jgi:hypothetical protein
MDQNFTSDMPEEEEYNGGRKRSCSTGGIDTMRTASSRNYIFVYTYHFFMIHSYVSSNTSITI